MVVVVLVFVVVVVVMMVVVVVVVESELRAHEVVPKTCHTDCAEILLFSAGAVTYMGATSNFL